MENLINKYNSIAKELLSFINKHEVTFQDIIDFGISKQQVYSVFRRGKTSLVDYRIGTLFKVVDALEKIIFTKSGEKVKINLKITF